MVLGKLQDLLYIYYYVLCLEDIGQVDRIISMLGYRTHHHLPPAGWRHNTAPFQRQTFD